ADDAPHLSTEDEDNGVLEAKARSTLFPGRLVVVSVDPVETLRPLFEEDEGLEKTVGEIQGGMKKYLAFIRSVAAECDQRRPASQEDQQAQELPEEDDDMEEGRPRKKRRLNVHLNLVHNSPPGHSKFDAVDPTMCVPIVSGDENSSNVPSASTSRRPMRLKGEGSPWSSLYAHTIMDAFATVSDLQPSPSADIAPSNSTPLALSKKDMKRYDTYQSDDRAKETSRFYSMRGETEGGHTEDYGQVIEIKDYNIGERVGDEDFEMEEGLDGDSQYRLSTVISGLSIDDEETGMMMMALGGQEGSGLRSPSASSTRFRAKSPLQRRGTGKSGVSTRSPSRKEHQDIKDPVPSPGNGPSAWKGVRSPARSPPPPNSPSPEEDCLSSKKLVDPLQSDKKDKEGYSPKSPTDSDPTSSMMLGGGRDYRQRAMSLSTEATSVFPEGNDGEIDAKSDASSKESAEREIIAMPLGQFDLAGGLGVNKPLKRQCSIHVRIWTDLSMCADPEDETQTLTDPRLFFEELKMLRTLEKDSDMRYFAQLKKANAERVVAWRLAADSTNITPRDTGRSFSTGRIFKVPSALSLSRSKHTSHHIFSNTNPFSPSSTNNHSTALYPTYSREHSAKPSPTTKHFTMQGMYNPFSRSVSMVPSSSFTDGGFTYTGDSDAVNPFVFPSVPKRSPTSNRFSIPRRFSAMSQVGSVSFFAFSSNSRRASVPVPSHKRARKASVTSPKFSPPPSQRPSLPLPNSPASTLGFTITDLQALPPPISLA
ncbi:7980_t:CDS:2, partial [Acaulospora colombiana]